jgi:membrane dipeptidase
MTARLLALLLAVSVCPAQTRRVSDAEVEKLHRSLLLIDTHNDITGSTVDGLDIGKSGGRTHTDITRLKAGNAGAVFFAVYVDGSYVQGNRSARRALEMIDTIRRDIVGRYPADFELVTSADGILAARKKGKIAALMGIEGGHSIEDSLRLLRVFHDLGIRYMTLTHNNTNNWADSVADAARHNGLTAFGKEVVREMNRLGMIVDISHVADKTFWDALETSSAPIFASHSSCRALTNTPRNMTDEMIRAMAKKGGVIQINFSCTNLSGKAAAAAGRGGSRRHLAELIQKYGDDDVGREKAMEELRNTMLRATLAETVAHIDHVVRLAGIDHVGIGSDFDGVLCTPEGLDDVSKFPNLTRALLEKGYSAPDIVKIYGGNTLRLMRAVEDVARKGSPSVATQVR